MFQRVLPGNVHQPVRNAQVAKETQKSSALCFVAEKGEFMNNDYTILSKLGRRHFNIWDEELPTPKTHFVNPNHLDLSTAKQIQTHTPHDHVASDGHDIVVIEPIKNFCESKQ